MTAPSAQSSGNTLVIVGVGLIGGSIALAARARNLFSRIVGLGRNPARLQEAVECGVLDTGITAVEQIPHDTSLVVVCTPVANIAADVQRIAPHLPPSAIMTDAGSTKRAICASLQDFASQRPTFVGSHPIAGSEKQGFRAGKADLFLGKRCVICPVNDHSETDIVRIENFWKSLGMDTQRMNPSRHDEILARTSHVPHVVASALAGATASSDLEWTGSGFRSTTRVAGGDPELWTGILLDNSEQVADGLAQVMNQFERFQTALANRDSDELCRLLTIAKERHQLLEHAACSSRLDQEVNLTPEDESG